MLSDQESIAIEEVLTLLYCCPSFQDFRKPVEILYPALWDQYQKAISTPVDLGNLLLKSKRGSLKINEMREYMQLVSKNCIKFNGNASIMVNIANHYTTYATALFEEILNLPFKDPSQTFKTRRIARRVERYEFVKSEPLNNRELKKLRAVLQDMTPPPALKSAVQQVISSVSQILFENAEVTEDSSGRLWNILLPIVETASSANDENANCEVAFVPANNKIQADFLPYLKQLDDAIGVLSAMIQERLLRGNTYSTRWLRPYNSVVWALPPKDGKGRAPWWPAFVVASASKLFPMHPDVSQVNLARIPDDIKTQLYKLRPRGNQHTVSGGTETAAEVGGTGVDASGSTVTPDSSTVGETKPKSKSSSAAAAAAKDLVVPEGYLLIEFFGTHDFGWIKADVCGPFKVTESEDGEFVHSPPPAATAPSSSSGGGNSASANHQVKTCSPEILKEAINAALYLEDLVLTAGEAIAEDLDLAVPTISELEETLMINAGYQSLTMLSSKPSSSSKAGTGAASSNGHSSETVKNSSAGTKRKSPVDKAMTSGGGEESRKKAKTASASSNGHSLDAADASHNSSTDIPGLGSVVSQSSISAEELNRCIVNNVLKISKCSLPPRKGVLMSSLTSTITTEAEGTEHGRGGSGKKRFFRENAVHRCKFVSAWMEQLKPLSFSHYIVAKQSETTTAKNCGGTSSAAASTVPMEVETSKATTTNATTTVESDEDYWHETKEKEPENPMTSILAKIKAAAIARQQPPEKRKYVFKHNNNKAESVEIGSFKKGGAGEEEGGATGTGNGGAKRVYTGTHLTSSGTNCFLLETGSSRHYLGEGSVYTRRVKWDAEVFFLESKSRAVRKAILKEELAYIAKAYKNIQEIAEQRAQNASPPPEDDSDEDGEGSSSEGADDGEEEDEEESEEEEQTHIQQAIKAQLQNVVSPIKNLPGKVGLIPQLERQRQQQLASKARVSISNMLPI